MRWWPAWIVLGLLVLVQAWVWLKPEDTRQYRVMASIAFAVIGMLLLLLWFLLLSRARWKTRLLVLAGIVAAGLAASQLLTIRGVTGDLRPILGWRSAGGVPSAEVSRGESGGGGRGAVADYPQFLGPDRTATVAGVRLARDWKSQPPAEVWRREVGEGWSGFAVSGDLAVTQEQHGDEERVVAYDLWTGEPRWQHGYEARFDTTIGGIGPRATPTIADGRVFALGATGILSALDLATGSVLWTHDVIDEHGGAIPEWGKSCSPLVIDGRVVVSAGGPKQRSLVAYDAASGAFVWGGGYDGSSYSSPFETVLAGRRQIVILNQSSVAGHDPETGELLWSHPWPGEQPNVAMPVVLPDDRLLVSSGYGVGSKVLALESGADGDLRAKLVWESPRLKAKFTNVVQHRGSVFGLDDGILVCLDPETGERCWKRGRYGHGQMVLADDLLLVTTEKGDVVLIEPTAEELRELGSFTAFERKTWNVPALIGRYLLVRNDREAAMFELAATSG